MSEMDLALLKGKYPETRKMSKQQLAKEVEGWRSLWGWVPSEVKYYVVKTGTEMAITMRNYKRHMGVLLETKWDITKLELGVYEKEYDPNTGEYFFERKIIQLNPQSVIDVQWIQERTPESEVLREGEEPTPPPTDTDNTEQLDTNKI